MELPADIRNSTSIIQLSDLGAGVVFGRKLDRPWLSPSGTAEGHLRVH